MAAWTKPSYRMIFWLHCAHEWRFLGEHSRENMVIRVRAILLKMRCQLP